jgi:hypothetical protein
MFGDGGLFNFSISPRLVNPHARRRAAAGLNAPARDYYSYLRH